MRRLAASLRRKAAQREISPSLGQLTATDVDDAAAALSFDLVGEAIEGLTISSDGTWSFDPSVEAYNSLAADATQEITVNYKVTDAAGATGENSFVITLTGTNDAPVATFSDPQAATESNDVTPLSGTLSAIDPDTGDSESFALVGDPIDGLTINTDGTWSFDATHASYNALAEGDSQEITVNYNVSDGAGATGENSFVITLTGTNDAPVAEVVDPIEAFEGVSNGVVLNGNELRLQEIRTGMDLDGDGVVGVTLGATSL